MQKALFLIVCSIAIVTGYGQVTKKYTIEQFYKNTSVGGGIFSPDEKKLLVHTNETGIFNLYEIDIATGKKKQLTDSKTESLFVIGYVPGTGEVLYTADQGGNENTHIYLKKRDGKVVDLTPGEKEKANFAGWTRDHKHLYYLSNARDPKFFDLYKMDVANWKADMLYKNDKGYFVSGLSDNEQYVALVQPVSSSSNNLYILDRKSDQLTKVNSESPARNNPAQFSNDNKTLYYTTNEDGEFTYAVKYDLASNKKEKLFETNWDVMYMYQSWNEKYRVVGINEDAKNSIRLFDAQTGKELPFPKIEGGDIQGVSISPSENKMRLSIGNAKQPNEHYLYDFKTKQLKKLTNSLNPEINPNDLVDAEIIRYKSFDGLEIPAVFYKPKDASEKNRVPAIVMVHGGPGGQARVGYFALVQYLVNHGYAVLDVNNRGSSGYGKTFHQMDDRNHGDKDLKDVVWGKRYLTSLPYIDGNKIGIMGGSYGGYMTAAAMAFHPQEFNVGVNIFGVTNWLRTLKSIPAFWEAQRKALYDELGDPNTEDSVRLYNISPLFHAANIARPFMVLQGSNDPRVLQIESDEIVAAVKKNNVPVEYVVFPDEGHGFRKKENEIKGYGQILVFLDKYLKGTDPKYQEAKKAF